jgi:hypothetical protein
MSGTLELLKDLVTKGEILISDHGYDELATDNLSARKLVSGLYDSELLEDYPDFPKGPCVLVLQQDENDQSIHVVWGIPKGTMSPAVLITVYRPDPARWTDDFRRRKK